MELSEIQGKVGEQVGTSVWIDVPQQRIDAFADATDDHQFIHVDPAAASATPFGGTIAHGMLTLSLIVPMAAGLDVFPKVKMSINYGFDKVRFLAPVKSGKRIRGSFRLLEMNEKRPGQWQQKVEVTVEIEGEEKPALIAEWIIQHFA